MFSSCFLRVGGLGGFAPLQLVSFRMWGCSLCSGLVKPWVVPAAGLVWGLLPTSCERARERERENGEAMWHSYVFCQCRKEGEREREGAGGECDSSSFFSCQKLVDSFQTALASKIKPLKCYFDQKVIFSVYLSNREAKLSAFYFIYLFVG